MPCCTKINTFHIHLLQKPPEPAVDGEKKDGEIKDGGLPDIQEPPIPPQKDVIPEVLKGLSPR